MDHQRRTSIALGLRRLADAIERGDIAPLSLVIGSPLAVYPTPPEFPKKAREGRVEFLSVTYITHAASTTWTP